MTYFCIDCDCQRELNQRGTCEVCLSAGVSPLPSSTESKPAEVRESGPRLSQEQLAGLELRQLMYEVMVDLALTK